MISFPNFGRQFAVPLLIVVWILLILCLIFAPSNSFIGNDVAYYLPLADKIGQGQWPLIDIPVHYSPLSIAILAIPNLFVVKPTYELYSLVQGIVVLLGATLTYLSLRYTQTSKTAALWGAAYYMFGGFYLELSIMLEVYVSLFVAASLVVLNRPNFLNHDWLRFALSGFFASLAVLSKQQGVFLVVGLGVIVFFQEPKLRVTRILAFCCGGGIGLAILVFIIARARLGHEAALASLTWAGRNYAGGALVAGTLILASLFVAKTSPFLVGITLISRQKGEVIPMVLALLISLVPALLKPYSHYFVLALPFSAIIAGWFVHTLLEKQTSLFSVLALLLLCFWTAQSVRLALRVVKGSESNLEVLRTEGKLMHDAIDGRRVLQFSSAIPMTYFAQIIPAGFEYTGFMFTPYFTRSEVREKMIPDADVVITDVDAESYSVNDGLIQISELKSHGFCREKSPLKRLSMWGRRCDLVPNE
jgi:hypothetical protein